MKKPTEVFQAGKPAAEAGQKIHAIEAIIPFQPTSAPDGRVPRVAAAPTDRASRPAAALASPTPKFKVDVPPVPKKALQLSPPLKRIEQRLTVIPTRTEPVPWTREATDAQILLPFPRRKQQSASIFVWFALCVALPTFIAAIYFCFIASNQYVTEFKFSVQNTTMSSSATPSGLMSLISGGGSSTDTSDSYIVTNFLTSQQAAEELRRRIKIEDLYSKPSIDWWSRFNRALPFEDFVKYLQGMVSAQFDMVTGIATARVRAFSPKDSLLIAKTLVSLSENLINGIEGRSKQDAVRFAKQEVEKAQDRLRRVHAQLTAYRNKFGIIDPTSSVAASNSTLIQSQRANLAQLETQLATFQSQNLNSKAPAIVALKTQIKSTKEQLAKTEAAVGRGNAPLSTVVGEYERLNLEVQFAQSMVTSTMQALAQARANAAAQHLYITPFVQPILPQSSTYPNRLLSITTVAALAFTFWLIALMIVRSIRERFG